jgi:hypothetical protein
MKFYKKILTISMVVLSITGCKGSLFSDHIACDDKDGLALLQQMLKNDVDKTLDRELKSLIAEGSIKDLDPAKLKLSAENISFSLTDSRTEFIDPNSPKTTCAIDLTATIPSDVVKKSDEARQKVERMSTAEQADELGLDFENGKVTLVLSYLLQPTDKKDKVLAVIKNGNNVNALVSDTLTYAFLKPQIEKNQVQFNQAIKQQQSEAQNTYHAEDHYEPEYDLTTAVSEAVSEYDEGY